MPNPFPTELSVDGDSYPDEKFLESMHVADDVSNMGEWMVVQFPKFVEQIGYGSCKVYRRYTCDTQEWFRPDGYMVIEYSTGGWSGQEQLINAVDKSVIGIFYLESWHRGGHYTFHIPMSALENVHDDLLP